MLSLKYKFSLKGIYLKYNTLQPWTCGQKHPYTCLGWGQVHRTQDNTAGSTARSSQHQNTLHWLYNTLPIRSSHLGPSEYLSTFDKLCILSCWQIVCKQFMSLVHPTRDQCCCLKAKQNTTRIPVTLTDWWFWKSRMP